MEYFIAKEASEDLDDILDYFLDGYIIFYQVFEDSVVIVRVVSGYRDLKSIFADVDDE